MKLLRHLVVLIVALLAFSACSWGDTDTAERESGASESQEAEDSAPDALSAPPVVLDLSSPTATVESLAEVFETRDFYQFSALLSASGRNRVIGESNDGLLFSLVAPDRDPVYPAEFDHHHDGPLLTMRTAEQLEAASRADRLTIDFAGTSVVEETIDEETATVTAIVAEREVAFELSLNKGTDWQIDRIAIDGLLRPEARSGFLVLPEPDCDFAFARRPIALRPGVSCDSVRQFDEPQALRLCAVMQDQIAPSTTDVEFQDTAARLEAELCPGDVTRLTAPVGRVPPLEVLETSTYGRLELSTPEQAANTVAELVAAGDYSTLILTLDVELQGRVSFMKLDYAPTLDGVTVDCTWPNLPDPPDAFFSGCMSTQTPAPVLDLTGGISITSTYGSELDWPDGETAIVVEATSPNHEEPIAFVVTESASGRWRLRQVATPPSALDPLSSAIFIATSPDA